MGSTSQRKINRDDRGFYVYAHNWVLRPSGDTHAEDGMKVRISQTKDPGSATFGQVLVDGYREQWKVYDGETVETHDALIKSTPAGPDDEYWEAMNERITRETLAIHAAYGAKKWQQATGFGEFEITAVPEIPNDDDPEEDRQYYVERDVLTHGPSGVVTGTEKRKYRIILERVDP